MNRNPQKGLKSLSIEKPFGYLITKLSKNVSVWRNLFLNRETSFKRECEV